MPASSKFVLVDDLSRLARDNHLMLSIIAELHFDGIRVISVADGLDSDDEESTLAIQVRGIFNELQPRDLKKTLRGQIGQKERGFFVGEKTFATARCGSAICGWPVEWIRELLSDIQSVLEQRTARSTQMLRNLLGPIRLEPQTPDIGRPFYRAVTTLDAVALIDEPPPGAEGGSNSLRRWRRRELNPRPQSRKRWRLRAYPAL
jgi:hypothetical protein